ncbi:hypothetical protein HK285_00995, partial [Streptococcus agalactiae]|nr:hypothetical protein [Streptococcus agalactiae]
MGSMITLGIGKMELDWGKNNVFNDHSCLFQKEDIKIVPYYYSDNEIEYKEGFSKNIMSVRRRLDLLGYSLYEIEELFNEESAMFKQLCSSSTPITFHDFYNTVINVDIQNINMASDEYDSDYDLGEYVRKCVIHEIKDLSNFPYYDAYDIGYFLENLDPYIT